MAPATDIDWPDGFDRVPADDRVPYPHNFRVNRDAAIENIRTELDRWNADTISIEVGNGTDPGVVAYFERDNQQFAFPCDRWDTVRDNAQAIAKYLNAKRALERYGVETIQSELQPSRIKRGPD